MNDLIFIAELCQNHNGNLNILNSMIEQCAKNGAKYVKIQNIFAKNLSFRYQFERNPKSIKKPTIIRPYKEEYNRLKNLELSYKKVEKFIKKCEEFNVIPLTTCFAREHIGPLKEIGFKAIKVASYDCASFQMIEELRKEFKFLIVSTGATYDDEIEKTCDILKNHKYALLHCITKYPTEFKDLNLSRIKFLQKHTLNVGYSDHSKSFSKKKNLASMLSILFGAKYIERHVTILDENDTKDGKVSIYPSDISEILKFSLLSSYEKKAFLKKNFNISNFKKYIGNPKRNLSQEELLNRDYYRGRFISHSKKDKNRVINNWEFAKIN